MARTPRFTDEEIEWALRKARGVKTLAARYLGLVYTNTITAALERSKYLQQVLEEIKEENLDLAEANVFTGLVGGERDTSKWYLTQQGKGRGYGYKTEVTGPGGGPVEMTWVELAKSVIKQKEKKK